MPPVTGDRPAIGPLQTLRPGEAGVSTGRRILSGVLLVWGLYGLAHPADFSLLDSVDLAIHETGHLVFGPFGEFIGFAGGTIMQLLMPMLFVVHFWRRGDRHAASVGVWWVAQNLGNIATYVADARAQELPLVGGGEHDWAYLLGELGWMRRDVQIAHAVLALAVLLVVGSSLYGLVRAGAASDHAPGAREPHRVHHVLARPAEDPAGGHHARGLRPVRLSGDEAAAASRLPLGRALHPRRGVLRLPRPPGNGRLKKLHYSAELRGS
jgi:hypothetical protein